MKKAIILIPFILAFILLSECTNTNHNAYNTNPKDFPGYQPFPNGFNYMDTVELKKAFENENIAQIREHGWKLFAGIMQPAKGLDWPVWYTWPNTYDAFAPETETKLASTTTQATLIALNKHHVLDTLRTPYYPMPQQVVNNYKNHTVFTNGGDSALIIGKHFMSNGDILIPTESMSLDEYSWIRDNKLYDTSALGKLFREGNKDLNAPPTSIITKHMYWPVLAGQVCAIPVWDTAYFPYSYAGYYGYEKWNRLVAVTTNPDVKAGGDTTVSYLYGVYQIDRKTPLGPITRKAKIYSINDFYSHKVTKQDWEAMDWADKASLNAASYWAYNKPFGVGDYLVTIAMHINTKELPTWALQTFWWTDTPNSTQYSQNRPKGLPKGPWCNYDMVDAYGIPVLPDSTLAMGMNPYIEGVIHPMQTNCNNCHSKAGYPSQSQSFPLGASYQDTNCKACINLLKKLTPSSACFSKYMRSDFQWIIPDHAQ